MRRKKMSHSGSKRSFSKNAKSNPRNYAVTPMRGGFRI